MAEFNKKQMRVGRVLQDDEKTMILEIHKDDDTPFTLDLENPDRFFTILFVRQVDGAVEVWLPWEEPT